MKKINAFISLFFLFYIIPTIAENAKISTEERFVNPIFYNKLAPLSMNERVTYLTPTQYKYSNSLPNEQDDTHPYGWTIEECKMLENEQNYIKLSCSYYDIFDKKMVTHVYTFKIDHCWMPEENKECKKFVIYLLTNASISAFVVEKDN